MLIAMSLIFIMSACGRDDDASPKPELVPVSVFFQVFKVEGSDSTQIGSGLLDQTVEDKVKITIQLDAPYRKESGNFTVTLYQLGTSDPEKIISNVGVMPANAAKWQSGQLKPDGSVTPFEFGDLRESTTHYVRITEGSTVVGVGRWNVYRP